MKVLLPVFPRPIVSTSFGVSCSTVSADSPVAVSCLLAAIFLPLKNGFRHLSSPRLKLRPKLPILFCDLLCRRSLRRGARLRRSQRFSCRHVSRAGGLEAWAGGLLLGDFENGRLSFNHLRLLPRLSRGMPFSDAVPELSHALRLKWVSVAAGIAKPRQYFRHLRPVRAGFVEHFLQLIMVTEHVLKERRAGGSAGIERFAQLDQ